ncbi:MAG TPA: hypothetical protein VFI91_11700 [Longimicrobiaceae bacterium]|nr:hypothetical protein [Longimicrobiaceae bacterium]
MAQLRAALRIFPLLIVTALHGCDNVEWGGADLDIVPPPPPLNAIPVAPDEQVFAEYGLPTGSVLFKVVQLEQGAQLIPVAEVSGDSLRTLRRPAAVAPDAFESKFREAVIPVGSQFELFRRGANVGTFVVHGYGEVTPCGLPTATGNATVVAAATQVPQFLAFRQGLAPRVIGEYSPPVIDGSINTYASIVAERLILQAGLPRPRSWVGAQRDLQALEIAQGANPEMAATYLVADSLAAGPAGDGGYSVFYIADYESRRGYSPVYQEVRDYSKTGKAAPKLLDYLNWDGREGDEILIQVFGEEGSWYEALGREGGEWVKTWEGGKC